jgi:hypothetical protein
MFDLSKWTLYYVDWGLKVDKRQPYNVIKPIYIKLLLEMLDEIDE